MSRASARGAERHVGAACPAPPSAAPGTHPRVYSRGSCRGKAAVVPFPSRGEAVLCGARRAAVAEGSGGP